MFQITLIDVGFFIEINNKKIGNIYLHNDNSIGLYLTDINDKLIYDIFKTIKNNFIINIPFHDIKLEKAIKSIGTETIQKKFLI